ncbi:MAG: tetratricopeptide repeat protein [Clostridia bacterium]|nr:tetratricopeptide repeat protein [Clostridia bacterium]
MFDLNAFFLEADRLYTENRIAEIEPYLLNGFSAAQGCQDCDAMLSIANELIGYYRVKSQYERCAEYADIALQLIEVLCLQKTEHHGTTLLNIATAYRAAGRYDEARTMYEDVLAIYQYCLPPGDVRIAGLHNNLSLLYQDMGDTKNALQQVQTAYDLIRENDTLPVERATTLTNLGLMQLKAERFDEAETSILRSVELFETDILYRDPHYSAALAAAAQLYFLYHDYDQSIQYYEKALEEIKKAYGENDYYQTTLQNLVLAKRQKKEEGDADERPGTVPEIL